MQSDLIEALGAIGLSTVEAKAYECLLRDGPATGYRVAHAIGHAVANTYAALASLQSKGAVITDGGEGKLARAVAPEEFLGRAEREFMTRRRTASRLLNAMRATETDHRVYRLENASQVLERARTMIHGATYCVVLDVFPELVEELREAIEMVAKRRHVVVKVYAPTELKGAQVILAHPTETTLINSWFGLHMHLVVDARECLLALLDRSMTIVRQAIWSGCPFVASSHHIGLKFEIVFTSLWSGPDPQISAMMHHAVRKEFSSILLTATPGYAALGRMLAGESPSSESNGKPHQKKPTGGARQKNAPDRPKKARAVRKTRAGGSRG